MESSPERPTPAEAAASLTAAEAARATLAHGVAVPSWFFASIAGAIAVQIATTAVGLGTDAPATLLIGLALFAAVASVQLARFRRLNGVWVGGFASRAVLGTATPVSASYAVALGAAIWAAQEAEWWLLALSAVAGGATYGLGGARWLDRYRSHPARHGRGEPALWLILAGAAALLGLGMLLLAA
jgi:hypothetical protein